ncbi:cell division protein ZapE [Rickettsiales bacterium]|nr:cell division protein ZapE [Rickettsiales bacterium]
MRLSYNSQNFILDRHQTVIFKELAKISQDLNRKKYFWNKLFNKNNSKSLYIYGSVGRGKSLLMNYFFNLIKVKKSYFHFNDFMQKIHKEMHYHRLQSQDNNILQITIDKILQDSKILCLDEFQVHDIVDAMILSDVFKYIFQQNIIVIFTSNSYPANLYKNGLQRGYFLRFINNILFKKCKILNLDGNEDYRSQDIDPNSNFIYPINESNIKIFDDILDGYVLGNKMTSWSCNILGRNITIDNSYNNIALIDFMELFGGNSGVADYMKICKKFDFIFVKNIPILNNDLNNETKRFILFIDEAYENNVKLIILSQNSIDKIYEDGLLYDLFSRAASRLKQLTNKK